MKSEATFASAKARERKNRIGSIGAGVRSSQTTKAATRSAPTASAPTISGLAHPWTLPRTRPQTIPKRPALARPTPARSSRPPGPWLSSSRRSASGTRTSPIGTLSQKIHCHEIALDDRAADERPERDREAADPAPGAEREPALLGRDRGAEQRQRQRHHERAAEPLHRAGDVERVDGRRERGRDRPEREDGEPRREDAPPPEAVAERGAGQEEDGERERVRVHRPLEVLERGAEVGADHGERRRDDEVVEGDHEERDRGDREGPERPRASGHRDPPSSCEQSLTYEGK